MKEVQARNQKKIAEAMQTPEGIAFQEKLKLHQEEMNQEQNSDLTKWMNYQRRSNPYIAFRNTPLGKFKSPPFYGYIELQYWGPLVLDDVEAFEFRAQPPDGEFLTELLRRKIKIRDGRMQPSVPWNPGISP